MIPPTLMTPASTRRRQALPAPPSPAAYFLDLDGTLLEIVDRPFDVRVETELRETIAALAQHTGGAFAIITGRSVADVDALFPGLHLATAGQHGLERRTAQGGWQQHALHSHGLQQARHRLHTLVTRHPALLLEDKGLSLAVHYRAAPALAGYVHRVVRGLQLQLGDDFCVQAGKRVIELKPCGRDKGDAVRDFMQEVPFRGRIPVFIGDDVTDEFAFAVVNELGGVSVKVGGGRTIAQWRMPDVTTVRQWLARAVATGTSSGARV
jgi:trehalose 6-phosphate phosphatase